MLITILFYSQRPILLLDEPLSSLDSYQAIYVINALKAKAAEGKTIIVTVHQPSLEILNTIDRFYLMSNGRLLYFGVLENIETHFEKAGVKLNDNENENITDTILSKITISDIDSTNFYSVKKLDIYQESIGINDVDLGINYYFSPKASKMKNLSWYCYYLFITIIRNTLKNVFSKNFIFFLWIPSVIFSSISLCKLFFNYYNLNYY